MVQVGVGELVPAVQQLVEHERNSLAAADTIAAAEQVVASQPDVLLHRIVAHFQHLFSCPRLEGVLPALNQVPPVNTCLHVDLIQQLTLSSSTIGRRLLQSFAPCATWKFARSSHQLGASHGRAVCNCAVCFISLNS